MKREGVKTENRIISIILGIISLIAIAEWLWNIRIIETVTTFRLPMPPDVALIFIIFSIILLTIHDPESYKLSLVTKFILSIVSIYGLIILLIFLSGIDFFLSQHSEEVDGIPIWQMSPITGLLFFVSGVTLLFSESLVKHKKYHRIIFFSGLTISFTGFTAFLGYLYHTPLLYGTDIIPIAFPTAVCFVLLGYRIILIVGNIFFEKNFTGGLAAARLIKVILPAIIFVILLQGVLYDKINNYLHINRALYIALICLVIILSISAYILQVTRVVFKNAIEAENKLRQEHLFNQLLLDNLEEGVAACDSSGKLTLINKTLMKWLKHDFREKSFEEAYKLCNLYHKDGINKLEPNEVPLFRVFNGEVLKNEEVVLIKENRTNQHFHVSGAPFYDENENQLGAIITMHDISEQKAREHERNTTIKLLQLLNERNNLHELIRTVTSFIHQWSGCEAVGIRMKEEEDYPYFESAGFSKEFIERERYLCARDQNKNLIRDALGNPLLECMCGNIICNRTDISKPFFTAHGSFYTNSTTTLLTTTSETDRQTRTRNRCNGEGYESVALIPLRSGSETLGLIQLNDKRPNCFTNEFIMLMEQFSDNIAIALQQRKTEAALVESEEKYRSLAESNNDYIMRYDRHGRHLYMNTAALEICGLSAEKIIGKTHLEAGFDKDQSHMWEVKIKEVFETGRPLSEQFKFESTKGAIYLDWRLTPEFDKQGKIKTLLGVSRDITQLKKNEEKLRILSRAVEQNPASVIITDIHGTIEYVNPKFTELTGYTLMESIGKNPRFLKSDHTPPETHKKLWNALSSGEVWHGEFVNRKKNGELYYESASISPIHDENKVITHFVAIKEDISEKKKLLQDIITAKEKAEENDKLKTAFLANMSHEIRTPMNAILGFSELLARTPVTEATLKRYSEIIHSRSGYLLSLIDDILDLSQVEAGILRLKIVPFQLNDMLDDLAEQLRLKINSQRKNIEIIIRKERSDGDSLIYTDKNRLLQLLINLSDNAVKFTMQGSITISCFPHFFGTPM